MIVSDFFWVTGFIFVTSLWVAIDARNLNVQKGKLGGGLFDMGVVGWFVSCLLLWIVAFPVYLTKRGEYRRLKQIKRLAELRQTGALTDEEFQAKKKELLDRV